MLNNIKKYISIILIFTIIFMILNSIFLNSNVKADSHRFDYSGSIDERRYPGFKSKIDEIKRVHPDWNIKIMETGLDWNEVIRREGDGVGRSPRSLVQGKRGEWIVSNQTYDNGSWRAASSKAISYVMDARNWLNPNTSEILQFMQLSYFNVSDEQVENALKGSFLAGIDNARIINRVSRNKNINAFFVIARLIQEQGFNGGGTWRMQSDGKNYYNPFNINATGNGNAEIIANALRRAKDKGWDTLEKGLEGGISTISRGYINEKQDTLYLQKFDVESKGGLYSNQYMQNIEAPRTEANILYNRLKNINDVLKKSITLIIPVFNNMPSSPSPEPNGSLEIGPINIRLKSGHSDFNLRETPSERSNRIDIIKDSSTIVLSIERSNTGWHRVALTNGKIGYIYFNSAWEQINDVTNVRETMSITGDDVALRAGPSTSEAVVTRLNKGSIVTRVDNTGRYNINGIIWDRVELSDGKKGFVSRAYISNIEKTENVYKVNVNDYLIMRSAPGVKSSQIRFLQSGVLVTVLEKGTNEIDGYTWDKIITAEGATGYVASKYLVKYGQPEKPNNETKPETKPETNVNLIDNKDDINKTIKVLPEAKADDLKNKYKNAKDITNEKLATGSTVNIDNNIYTIIKIGDVNKDGRVKETDAVDVLKYSIELIKLDDIQLKAADVNKDGRVKETDAVNILKYAIELIKLNY